MRGVNPLPLDEILASTTDLVDGEPITYTQKSRLSSGFQDLIGNASGCAAGDVSETIVDMSTTDYVEGEVGSYTQDLKLPSGSEDLIGNASGCAAGDVSETIVDAPMTDPVEGEPRSYTQESRLSSGSEDLIGNASGCAAGFPDGASTEMPLLEYLHYAAKRNAEDLGTATSWRGVAFTFARWMKAHPELSDLSSQEAGDCVDELLARIYPNSRDPWREHLGFCDSVGNEDDPFEHFVHCWDIVRSSCVEDPLEYALRMAQSETIVIEGYENPRWSNYLLFLSVCRWLQVRQRDQPFYAPVRKLGEAVGVAAKSISNYRARAEREGYLLVAKRHDRRRATEFWFNFKKLERDA